VTINNYKMTDDFMAQIGLKAADSAIVDCNHKHLCFNGQTKILTETVRYETDNEKELIKTWTSEKKITKI
jgi:hypothetical protein